MKRQVPGGAREAAAAQRRQARLEAPPVVPAPRPAPIVAPAPSWLDVGLVGALVDRAGEFDFWEGEQLCPY